MSALGVEEQRVRVLIDLVSPSALRQSLGDGFRVDVRIIVHEAADATRVPVGALFRREAGWAVFAVADGRARERPVTLDRRGATAAAVRSGLTPGDRVILFPPSALRDGAGVATR